MDAIQLRSVTITRPSQHGPQTLLTDFDLQVGAGEHVLLIGANGAGKSSLLNVIAGVERPADGVVALNRAHSAYVPQDYKATLLPWFSAERNALSLALYRGVPRSVAAQRLSALADSFGVDFPLQRRAGALSGGQQQLLCILRALVTEPALLILDEPCSALSEARTEQFWEVLARRAGDAAWLVTSHQVGADIQRVDRVVALTGEHRCKTANL